MKRVLLTVIYPLLLAASFAVGSISSSGRAERADSDAPSTVYVSGHILSIYYPGQKRVFVYSELGGNCVFAYTLSTPGGMITRENCK